MKTLRNLISHPLFVLVLRVALGLVFIVASLDKIENPGQFAKNIANYRLLPYEFTHGVAIVLPWLEVTTGSLLVLGIWTRANALLTSSMLLVFIFAVSQALWRQLDISCGCFSTDPLAHKMTRWTLYWDVIWFSWGVIVIAFQSGAYSLPEILRRKKVVEN
jgi:putative oxidoreductase